MLTDSQRTDLHTAIVGYLASQGQPVDQLALQLGVAPVAGDNNTLEQKWTALVRLQRRILDLEAQNTQLQKELASASAAAAAGANSATKPALSSSSSSLANWLPKWPPRLTLTGHRSRVTSVAFHPAWSILASSSDDSEIKIWDSESGELEKTIKSHTRAVHGLAFSPVSQLLVSCSADLSVKIFDPRHEFANIRTLLGHDHTVSAVCVVLDPGSKREFVVSASRDKTVRLWELETGFISTVLRGHTDWVRCLAATNYSEGSHQYLLSAGSDRTVRLTQLFGGPERESVVYDGGHTHVIECCAVAPPESAPFIQRHLEDLSQLDVETEADLYFATGGRDCVISVWSAKRKRPLLRLVGHDNWVQGVQFHPNGRFLVSVGDDKTMRVWDLATAKLVRTINAHSHFVTGMSWRGKRIATGSVDQQVRVW